MQGFTRSQRRSGKGLMAAAAAEPLSPADPPNLWAHDDWLRRVRCAPVRGAERGAQRSSLPTGEVRCEEGSA